ncbi:hypothetical protein I6F33_14830 [Bradyrhizobium sp. BRP20]|uniref:hypothetical protein n=1 Tax=Bradyrhizobium sp. BRP20 TaxID=2793822 RepID=UPI001CD65266|nr:hypothetical protein [Bradyrhizobium sp. BRP20]MCA1434242.1 hypothetical protein [Bradyrhizobium sp. BRP20]
MTVPVVIFFSKARERIPRDDRAVTFNFVDVFGKGARGRIQQGTAANRTTSIYTSFMHLQGAKPVCLLRGHSSVPIAALCCVGRSASKALSIDRTGLLTISLSARLRRPRR